MIGPILSRVEVSQKEMERSAEHAMKLSEREKTIDENEEEQGMLHCWSTAPVEPSKHWILPPDTKKSWPCRDHVKGVDDKERSVTPMLQRS